jgi:hypothetical protein
MPPSDVDVKAELPRPVAVGGIVLLVAAVLVGGFFLLRSVTKGDLDGQVVHPKPWAPPGAAAAFKGATHGAPANAPQGGTANQ